MDEAEIALLERWRADFEVADGGLVVDFDSALRESFELDTSVSWPYRQGASYVVDVRVGVFHWVVYAGAAKELNRAYWDGRAVADPERRAFTDSDLQLADRRELRCIRIV